MTDNTDKIDLTFYYSTANGINIDFEIAAGKVFASDDNYSGAGFGIRDFGARIPVAQVEAVTKRIKALAAKYRVVLIDRA